MDIRLQKRIAESGFTSRRKAEELIIDGKVKVNGEVVSELGSKVTLDDVIEVSGQILRFDAPITIMLNKPAGYITSKSDPHHDLTVMDLLPEKLQHLNPVGRLDKDSEGLLLLSSDGELTQKLTHPSHEHVKTYEVKVNGLPTEEELEPMRSGQLELDNYQLNPMEFSILSTHKNTTLLEIKLNEGRKRQIRRVMENLGFPVLHLNRIKIGSLELGDLDKGKFKTLSAEEIALTQDDQ